MIRIITIILACSLLTQCARVPITGRRQMNLLSESELMKLSFTEYNKFLKEHPAVPTTDPRTQQVQKVGARVKVAVEKYMKANKKYRKRIAGYKWVFNLVDDKTANAWCMPGGKVVVYTGLLPITANEAGLAVVMGHEIAHAIARHGNERMSQAMAVQMGGVALSVATSTQSAGTQKIFNESYGVASGLGSLAYSRKHELEADKLGLVFMAMAGYDPREALGFWIRMSDKAANNNLNIVSTHPSDEKRLTELKAFLPKALKYYKPTSN